MFSKRIIRYFETKHFDKSLKDRLERARIDEMSTVGFWVAGPIAIALTLQANLMDLVLHPEAWRPSWLFARLGVIPVGAIAMYVLRSPFKAKYGDLVVSYVALYLAGIFTFMVTQSGHLNSKLWLGFVQLAMGITIIPLKKTTYFLLTLTIFLLYFSGSILLSPEHTWKDFLRVHFINVDSYGCLILLIYITIYRARKAKFISQIKLEDELTERQKKIDSLVASEMLVKEAELTLRVSQQVAHDIRSPLTALNIILDQKDLTSESLQSLLKSAIKRVNSIAIDLLKNAAPLKERTKKEAQSMTLAASFENLIEQKRVELNLSSDQLTYTCEETVKNISEQDRASFERVLSNLINNSFEASDAETCKIAVKFESDDEDLILKVSDSGTGIKPDVLNQIGKRGFTTKYSEDIQSNSGFGLGISYALSVLEKRNGTLTFLPIEAGGTVALAKWKRAVTPI